MVHKQRRAYCGAMFLGSLASRFVARPAPLDGPGVERFSAAVVFADISGFTPLAERLARRGPAGAEELSTLLNAYFPRLTALIAEHGGEVITFAGDGLLAVWPATDQDDGLATATCRCRAVRPGRAVGVAGAADGRWPEALAADPGSGPVRSSASASVGSVALAAPAVRRAGGSGRPGRAAGRTG